MIKRYIIYRLTKNIGITKGGEGKERGAAASKKGYMSWNIYPFFDGFKHYFSDSTGASEGTRLTILFGLG